jgi:flagellar protein FliO/FliZ
LARGLAIVLTPTTKMEADAVQIVDGHVKVAATKLATTSTVEAPKPAEIHVAAVAPQPIIEQAKPVVTAPAKAAAAPTSSPMRNFFTLTILVAAAAAAIVFAKKRSLVKLGQATSEIELISVKALGAKQRLAVVEVGGERMLIAATDQGLQLLSKLDMPTAPPQPTQAQSLADFASALEDAQGEPAILDQPKPKARRSTDVAGLIKLRAASAWSLGNGGDLT